MSYYANIVDGIVVRNVKIDGKTEPEAIAWLQANVAHGEWVRNWYDASERQDPSEWRYNYPGPGFSYDPTAAALIAPQPYPSWTLNDSMQWQAPVPPPEGPGPWVWDEETLQWVKGVSRVMR